MPPPPYLGTRPCSRCEMPGRKARIWTGRDRRVPGPRFPAAARVFTCDRDRIRGPSFRPVTTPPDKINGLDGSDFEPLSIKPQPRHPPHPCPTPGRRESRPPPSRKMGDGGREAKRESGN
ncbi:hypothetical protein NL676_038184 [Syzygium grande]|nr:hypothetical protein NL676_038184 [Syzygium grande]